MQGALYILALGILLLIFYQDLRYRGVSWYLFPLTLLVLSAILPESVEWGEYGYHRLLNLGFLGVQSGLLLLYFHRRKVSLQDVRNQYIGLGDVLFFLVLALVLPFPVFPVFMVASLLISLLIALLAFRKSTVPLAGLQALLLAVYMLWQPVPAHSLIALNLIY